MSADGQATSRRPAFLFAATIFLSAFLLFQIEPIAGKKVLPWFGGGATVWITTLVFFQFALLAGYGYAHFIALRLAPRAQGFVHIGLLLLSIAALPVILNERWTTGLGGDPALRLLLVLTLTVGPPFLLLSTTGPLVQHWFAQRFPHRSPYPLYALSNIGSLLALLSYPVFFERYLGLRAQSWLWAGAYLLFVSSCALIALRTARSGVPESHEATGTSLAGLELAEGDGETEAETEASTDLQHGDPVTPGRVVLWIALPACASALLLAVTNQLTQDVAGVPLLWVLPLAVYLVTFILCFSDDRTYDPLLYTAALIPAGVGAVYVLTNQGFEILYQTALYLLVLFLACMSLHGETSLIRPHTRHLTAFYLMVSLGGALGGVFVALVAPLLFAGYWEYHIAILATPLLVLLARFRALYLRLSLPALLGGTAVAALLLMPAGGRLPLLGVNVGGLAYYLTADYIHLQESAIRIERDFYGVVRVFRGYPQLGDPVANVMQHGRINHGFQFVDEELRAKRTGYYGPNTAVGMAMEKNPNRGKRPLTVGITGLGAGMIAAYAERGDDWSFYEISPLVVDLAEKQFTYLADARARGVTTQLFTGDARTVLESQLPRAEAKQFDVLVLDAFTSDAVPVHLLTREALAIYRQHLRPDGMLLINISNAYLDISPVVRGLGEDGGFEAHWTLDDRGPQGRLASIWVVLTNNRAFLDNPEVRKTFAPWPDDARPPVLWTDDYSNLYRLIKLY